MRALPGLSSLVFDGYSIGARYIFGVFACYPSNNSHGFEKFLLSFSTFEDEKAYYAEQHIRYIQYVLTCYSMSWETVVAIIAERCAVKRCLGNRVDLPLIGCASHRFKLAVQDKLNEENGIAQEVHSAVKSVRYGLLADRLRIFIPFCPLSMNDTRWSSSFCMLQRYVKLRRFLNKLNDTKLDIFLFSPAEECKVDNILDLIKEME